MTQLLFFVFFFFVLRPAWADDTSLPNIHVADCFDGENVILAPGSICHDAGGMWRCRESPTGGALATLCDDENDYSRAVSLSDIEAESGENVVTTGEFGLGELFTPNLREVRDACSEAEAVIIGCDTDANNSSDIGIRVYGSVTEGPVLKSIQTNVDTTFGLNDNQAFRIKDATTPTANDLFIVPEDGSSPSPEASTTTRGFVEKCTTSPGETGACVVQGDDVRLVRKKFDVFYFRANEAAGANDDGGFLLSGANNGGTPAGSDNDTANSWYPIPFTCTLQNLCCQAFSLAAASNYDLTVRTNGVATALTVNLTNTNRTCDTTNTPTGTAGERVAVMITENGTGGDSGHFWCSLECQE